MLLDEVDGGGVEVGDAVPEDIPLRCLDQDAALADCEFGFCPDGDEAWVRGEGTGFVGVFAGVAELLEGCPGLARGRDELAC